MFTYKDENELEKWDWYISIGSYKGPLNKKKVYWNHYILYGTKRQAKYMYAKKKLESVKNKISLRECVKQAYFKDAKITDEIIENFLDYHHLDNNKSKYCNDGWKKLLRMSDYEIDKDYFMGKEPIVIRYDDDFSFDKKY